MVSSPAVAYNLHEFGSMDAAHDFAYWPGPSLNPALWDLSLMHCALSSPANAGPMFDPADPRFEQSWALRAHEAGLRVAHLPSNVFVHAGGDNSAYVINQQQRPWDPPTPPPAH